MGDFVKRWGMLLVTWIGLLLLLEEPVLANVPIGWGMAVVRAPLTITEGSRGLAALVIVVLEGLILGRIPEVGLVKGFLLSIGLNFISAVLGFFLNAFVFSAGSWLFLGFFIIPYLTVRLLRAKGAPKWYSTVAVVTFLIGAINTALVDGFSNPYSTGGILVLIELSLLYLFSFTITCEGYFFGSILKEKANWKILFIANVASYLVLAFMFPYFAPNPAGGFQFRKKVENLISQGETQQALDMVRLQRSNAQYLMELQPENTPPPDYEAYFEISLLTRHSPQASETGLAILNDALTVPTITTEAREKLEWLHGYFTHWLECQDAIKAGDQNLLDSEFRSWLEWDAENKYPDQRVYAYSYDQWETDPVTITTQLLEEYESSLTLPVTATESDNPLKDPFGVLGGEDDVSTSQ